MRSLLRMGSAALLLAALLVPWQTLDAQDRQGNWIIYPRIGLIAWDDAAAIQDPLLSGGNCDFPEVGMECSSSLNNVQAGISVGYYLTPSVGVGLAVDISRPITNGAYFPAVEFEVAGEQSLTFVNQRLTIADAVAQVEWAPSVGALKPFLNGGVGIYAVWPEAKKEDKAAVTGFQSFTDLMFQVGVGLDWSIGETTGFRIELSDQIYTGWDRDELYPIFTSSELPDHSTQLFPDLLEDPPEDSSTLNNFRLMIGFTFMPGM
ncbi:MAG: hypothetical protein GWN99_12005 [Gemmatimonadetes bacterium]|uniref:Outer membrane protein beta-barrel domain-containing protein n=1 Tax=Candidatus Kutchimonas denitrificans TaxID=3056748 RepID=A0AAE4Z7W9_9BACT|nr:hypothetical protein [Gemmatimonadota bacterium]NIR75455.1 hypothetical protein [Candidatus Kutchimonas denitrificans]NIS01769.1 hypothetical protein [Gemmatimonadota bacterium]NIT67550.1 hypothetical protein [Gemmatimonadota bacterium]NIU53424.1 hypothetical protein [Gemmatimonadota bacterium]